MTMSRLRVAVLTGVCLLALAGESWADTTDAANSLGEIVVTGSRLVTNGSEAPTPVTVMSAGELQGIAPTSIADALNQLPQFLNSNSGVQTATANPATANTANNLNLRNLGPVRALNLVNGLRLPPDASTGLVDANLIPTMLLQRVDVVTGGASAAYGSDAVSGVINFVLDKKFDGLAMTLQGGGSEYGDYANGQVGVAGGTSLANGRLHIEGSAEVYKNDGIDTLNARPLGTAGWDEAGAGTQASPYFTVSNAASTNDSPNGLFVTGPLAQNSVINGKLVPFVPGITLPGGLCLQCNGSIHEQSTISLIPELTTEHAFGRADYQITDSIDVFAQVLYGRAGTEIRGSTLVDRAGGAATVIYPTNAFLPAGIASQIPASGSQFAIQGVSLPPSVLHATSDTVGTSFGLEGSLFNRFKWDVDYGYSRSEQDLMMQNVNNVNLRAALDAVVNPANGQIVCNVTLTHPGSFPGCVPINLFGIGAPSAAAYNYVQGISTQTSIFDQHTVDVNLRGDLFSWWAGAVSAAIGGEYRTQDFSQTSNGAAVDFVPPVGVRGFAGTQFVTANYAIGSGSENVKEGYVEMLAPLLKDVPGAESLDLDMAARHTDYSTSGDVNTWKIGPTWQPIDDIRFRATRSRDIRAPTLVELYQGQAGTQEILTDAKTGVTADTQVVTGGNPTLKPETSNTLTAGAVITPRFVPNLTLSADYYNINISNAIAAPYTYTQINTLCNNGTSSLCGLITRPLGQSNTSTANFPTAIEQLNVNVADVKTSGMDFEGDYATTIGDGRLNLRVLANYLIAYTQKQSPSAALQVFAGNLDGGPNPLFRATGIANYSWGNYDVTVEERFIGHVARSLILDYSDTNEIPHIMYTNLEIGYTLPVSFYGGGNMRFFFNVQNLFNQQPPLIPNNGTPNLVFPTNRELYDVIGTDFMMGVRAKF